MSSAEVHLHLLNLGLACYYYYYYLPFAGAYPAPCPARDCLGDGALEVYQTELLLLVGYGMVLQYGMVWYGFIIVLCYGIWYTGIVWYIMVWYVGMARYGMVWYGTKI